MKTNSSPIRHLAILVGTLCIAAPALAETAKPVRHDALQVQTVQQPQMFLALASCTRVGNRMVC